MFLNAENLHGFSILKKLTKSNVADYSDIDPTGLYRTLKKMEAAGLLSSTWDTEASTQPRRMYRITKEGKHCLAFWGETLQDYATSIGKLSRAVNQSVKSER